MARTRVINRASISQLLAAYGACAGQHARAGERLQPADVGLGDEVPGRAHHVGAQDTAGRELALERGGGEVAGA